MKYIKRSGVSFSERDVLDYQKESGLGELVSRLLLERGVGLEELASFLHPKKEDLLNPFSFGNMEAVCRRIKQAVRDKERITVYADYDADGTCGCALLYQCLKELGAAVDCYIPDRFLEGYGTNEGAIRRLGQGGTKLLVTVDCGIRSVGDVAIARSLGADVIILDHHECGQLPDTPYIIDPKMPGEAYENQSICGCGVAFKVACALMGEAAFKYVDLAGVATIGDIVSLTGENRAIARLGIEKLRCHPNLGLKCLADLAGIQIQEMDSQGISFGLVPRINAAGRMEHAKWALRLLLAKDEEQAKGLAEKICAMNSKRQAAQRKVSQQVMDKVLEEVPLSSRRMIMAYGPEFEQGVVGLAASAVAEKFCRPTVIFSERDGVLTGSARSLEGIDIYDALNQCADKYIKFGGHAQAAGLSMGKELLPQVNDHIDEYLRQKYEDDCFLPKTVYDQPLAPEEITLKLIDELALLEPFGQDNPAPVFLIDQVTPKSVSLMGPQQQHLKFSQGETEFLYFKYPTAILPGEAYRFCGSLGKNTFRGKETPQFVIQHGELAESQREWNQEGFLRELPKEISSFARWIQEKAGGALAASQGEMEERIRLCFQKSAFGSGIVVNTKLGFSIFKQMNIENIQYIGGEARPWSAENCVLLRASGDEALKNYENVFAIGAFAYEGKKAVHLFDERVLWEYMEQGKKCMDQLERCRQGARQAVQERRAYDRIGAFVAECAKIAAVDRETAWLAINIFFSLKLIEAKKSDKIHFIYNDIEANYEDSALYRDLQSILQNASS